MILSSPKQRQLIGFFRKALKLDEETYRDLLAQYGVDSSKNLTTFQAEELISSLKAKAIGFGLYTPKINNYYKFSSLGYRRGMATPKQLRLIDVLWKKVSVQTTDEAKEQALNHFIFRITGKLRLNFLTHEDVQKVVNALNTMEKRGSNV